MQFISIVLYNKESFDEYDRKQIYWKKQGFVARSIDVLRQYHKIRQYQQQLRTNGGNIMKNAIFNKYQIYVDNQMLFQVFAIAIKIRKLNK